MFETAELIKGLGGIGLLALFTFSIYKYFKNKYELRDYKNREKEKEIIDEIIKRNDGDNYDDIVDRL